MGRGAEVAATPQTGPWALAADRPGSLPASSSPREVSLQKSGPVSGLPLPLSQVGSMMPISQGVW